jgi:hypothetical protein
MMYRRYPYYLPLTGDRLAALKTHLRRCLWLLDCYGRVCREDRRRALGRWPDLRDRTDADAYREALRRLDQPPPAPPPAPVPAVVEFRPRPAPGPALPPAAEPREWLERRRLARELVERADRLGPVLRLPTSTSIEAVSVRPADGDPGRVLSYFEAVWRLRRQVLRRQADEEEAAWWD